MRVGVLVFVAYALVQANQLGGSTPTYDVYDSDNYPLVSSTTQKLPCECHHGLLATMQCTVHVLHKAQPLAIMQCTEHVSRKAQPLAIMQCTEHVLPKAQPLAITQMHRAYTAQGSTTCHHAMHRACIAQGSTTCLVMEHHFVPS